MRICVRVVMPTLIAMRVIVIMTIQRQGPARSGPEQRAVFGGRGHNLWSTLTTHMPVEANHPVRRAHHDVQLMTDHQNGAARVAAHCLNLLVKRG